MFAQILGNIMIPDNPQREVLYGIRILIITAEQIKLCMVTK